MRKEQLLLGITKEKEIAFCDVDIRERKDGTKEFSACFNCVTPFEDEETNGVEYARELLYGCYDEAGLYRLCEEYDCTPSNLPYEYASMNDINMLSDTVDCSVYSNTIYIDGNDWKFESSSCGQHDIGIDGMLECTNTQAFYTIYRAWKQYHLEAIPQEEVEKVLQAIEQLDITPQEEETKIKQYIEKYIIND